MSSVAVSQTRFYDRAMMQAFRRFSESIFMRVLFVVLLVAFLIWGIGDVFRSRSTDSVVADVGNEKITTSDLDTNFKQRLDALSQKVGGKIDAAMARRLGFEGTVLNAMVDETLIKIAARDWGFRVGNKQALAEIQAISMFLDDKTFQFSPEKFKRILAANQRSETEFVKYLKQQVAAKTLLQGELGAMPVPQTLTDALYRYRNQARSGQMLKVLNSAQTVANPTQTQLDTYYQQHAQTYAAPEYRSFAYLALTLADVGKSVVVSPEELQAAFKQHQSEMQVPERRELSQVIVESELKARELADAARTRKNLTDAAKATGHTVTDLGLMVKKDLPDVLQEPVFTAAAGTILPPIKSAFGWHVVSVRRIDAAHDVGFDEAKPSLEADLKAEAASRRLAEMTKKIDDQLAGGATLADAGAIYSLKPVAVENVDATGHLADGSEAADNNMHTDIIKAAFAAEKDALPQMQATHAGGSFAVQVEKITPPSPRPLSEVTQKVTADFTADARAEAATRRAAGIIEKVTAGTPLAAAAKDSGSIVQPIAAVTREDHSQNMPTDVIAALFSLGRQGEAVLVKGKDGPVIVSLTEIMDHPAASKEEMAALAQTISTSIEGDLSAGFNRSLREIYPVKVHADMLEKMRNAN